MNTFWKTDADTMILFFKVVGEITEEMGRELTREEREIVFFQLMKSKGIKPSGNTELNKKEFIREIASKGNKILNIDSEGYTFIKPKEI